MRTLLRVAVSATFLASVAVLGGMALSDQAQSQSVAAKGDMSLPPAPRPKPILCELPMWYLAELAGWRILEGAQAKSYLAAAFKTHPPADAVAFTVSGGTVAVVLSKDGCIVGRRMMPAKMHAKFMTKAFGFSV